ncbi:MAG: hypothetical protein PHV36_03640 [Elusimicrobiales bacterium]|nr:hypothetical protein [Elusimicrobiales bacterium]
MKKIIIAAVLTLSGVSASFAADTWGKVSLFDKAAYPQADSVRGIELGLIYSNTRNLTGIQWTFVFSRTSSLEGLQMGLATSSDKASGIQWGALNMTKDMKGAQVGFVNYAEKFSGLQFGLVNYAAAMGKGLQLGLVNVIRNSTLPVMVIANARF